MERISNVAEFSKKSEELLGLLKNQKRFIAVCTGTACQAYGSLKLLQALKEAAVTAGLADSVEIAEMGLHAKGGKDFRVLKTGCHGFCERGPLVVIHPQNILYQRVKPEHAADIINKTIAKGEIIDELLYDEPETKKKIIKEHDIPFYAHQTRLILGANGIIDPTNIKDYIGIGGYRALAKCFTELKPADVVEIVKKSGLRGRGGGGFPAGRKWESTAKAKSPDGVKYIVCNADEGDPGAFMNRSTIEGNPHSIIEGMIIAAYAIGGTQGYIYVRHEYPLAVERLIIALDEARAAGFLGDNILGTGMKFDIKINKGGGAFVCGESSALMASIEGNVGEPRAKHIHMSESGLFSRPTNLNNVESYANVPLIINKGVEYYTKIGTEGSKGTKIFSLVGKVNNTGLVEVPMGISLRDIIFKVGQGIIGGRKFKAVQTGGPSGGCIPDSQLDMPVDFDALTAVGSMMGSGGMIVMDERTCMVDVAKYFTNFLKEESCGKCTSCREGLRRIHDVLTKITSGKGEESDLKLLEDLAEVLTEASLCQLGKTAANPLKSTLKYFREEYEAHIKNKKCPAKVCKPLIVYSILSDKCTGCGICKRKCPSEAIAGDKKVVHVIDQNKCIKCGICLEVCPTKFGAVAVD